MKKFLSITILSIVVLLSACSKNSNNSASPTNSTPSSPINLTAALVTNSQISLNWVDSSSNETGFHIERKNLNGTYSVIATVGANVNTYLDNSTTANTTYVYRVNAFNTSGNSINYTNEVTVNTTLGVDSLVVTLSTNQVENNGWDQVLITVKDKLTGADVTATSNLFINSGSFATPITSAVFTPYSNGSFTISATQGTILSNLAPLTVVSASPSAFTHKILVEDYTSSLCGYCPREFYDLDTYTQTHPKCAWVAVHCTGLGQDNYAFQYSANMESKFGVSGYPTTIVNRRTTWGEDTATLNAETAKWTGLGLALNSSISGNTITGTAQVKFNFTTTKPLKIVIAMVESGLLASQDNYYSPSGGATPYLYNGQNPIPNFNEKYCFRATTTDAFGDSIPVAATYKNNVYTLPFTFNLSGVNAYNAAYTLKPANCRIVAYVLDGSTAIWSSTKGVLNVQYAAVGAAQPFD